LRNWDIPIVLEQPELLEQNLCVNDDRRGPSQWVVEFGDEWQHWVEVVVTDWAITKQKKSSSGSQESPRIFSGSSFERRQCTVGFVISAEILSSAQNSRSSESAPHAKTQCDTWASNSVHEPTSTAPNMIQPDSVPWAVGMPDGPRRRSLNNSDPRKSAPTSKWIGSPLVGCGSSSGRPRKWGHHSGGRTTEAVYNTRFLQMYAVNGNSGFDWLQGVKPNITFDLAWPV
jgi:hypothetical protein